MKKRAQKKKVRKARSAPGAFTALRAKLSAASFRRAKNLPRIAAVAAGVLLVAAAGYYAWAVNHALDFSDAAGENRITISPGDTLSDIGAQLLAHGAIGETLTLKLLGKWQRVGTRIQSGKYHFPRDISLRELLRNVAAGRGRATLKVSIIEGWTFRQMRARLRAAPDLKQDSMRMHDEDLMAALGHPGMHPEGRFAPDTYHYAAGASDITVYRAAFALQQKRMREAWESRDANLRISSAEDALILASIIEKESTQAEEQRRVSGVFHNRLRKGMRLQADPTVIYGLGESYKGKLTRAHLRADTAYNTYTRGGLTPTPISLPGMSALRAAVQPEKTGAFYFVSKGNGLHHFSVTLKQHNRAVQKYRRRK